MNRAPDLALGLTLGLSLGLAAALVAGAGPDRRSLQLDHPVPSEVA